VAAIKDARSACVHLDGFRLVTVAVSALSKATHEGGFVSKETTTMTKTLLGLALAASIGFAGLAAQTTAAEAHSGLSFGIQIGGHPHGGFFFGPRVFFGPRFLDHQRPVFVSHPCRGLRIRAELTGSRFWYRQWQQCRFEHSNW
jgi:hypothetical protein